MTNPTACRVCNGALLDDGTCPNCVTRIWPGSTQDSLDPYATIQPLNPPRATAPPINDASSREDESRPNSASSTGPSIRRGSSMSSRQIQVNTEDEVRAAVEELLDHRRATRGKIIGMAGMPRHGKTELANRLREKFAQRQGADNRRYEKTVTGQINIYYIPGRFEHHVLIDIAGEDFQRIGDDQAELPKLLQDFLWPVMQVMDGFLFVIALPVLWAKLNRDDTAIDDGPQSSVRENTRVMTESFRVMLKYAMVASDLDRLMHRLPNIGLSRDQAPTRQMVDDAFASAVKLRAPVAVAFTKADLYEHGPDRPALIAPPLPRLPSSPRVSLHPLRTDPLLLGHAHFPELFEFLVGHVRHFKFDFVQALHDDSVVWNPYHAPKDGQTWSVRDLIGGESMLEFLAAHPWRVPGLSSATAIKLDRLFHRARWEQDLLDELNGHSAE